MTGKHLLLLGGNAGRLCVAGGLARDLGATITIVDDLGEAAAALDRQPFDLMLVEVCHDVEATVGLLHARGRIVPLIACGVGVPGELAVAAVRAGARDYVPLPPSRACLEALIAGEGSAPAATALVGHKMETVERALILETLERCRGNRTAASQLLGISVRTMRNKLRAFLDEGVAVPPAA